MNPYVKEFWTDRRPQFISLMLLVYLISGLVTGYQKWTLVALVGGLLLFFVIEYFIHRFFLHGLFSVIYPVAYKGHEAHHKDPKAMKYLLTPNSYNIPYHFLLWIVFSLATGSFHLGSVMMVGFTAYQLWYEWIHFVSHRPIVPRTAFGKWMKKFHLLHHYKHEGRYYGVTHPTFDILFGTDGEEPKKNTLSQ
jgi:sterol desaturase/sphingolipid hydroxylase (fatty acid hydroxylase superfamily)